MKKYQTIYADPPWKYPSWGKPSNRADYHKPRPLPYPALSNDEIKSMNINSLADENCELYLWTTNRYLPVAFEVIKAWGFKYCQTLTWCKTPRAGMGGMFCPTTEFLLLCRVGKAPKKKRILTTWWHIKRPHNKHSKKPDFFRNLIESVTNEPRIELFAREKTPGWDVWGNEVESDIEL